MKKYYIIMAIIVLTSLLVSSYNVIAEDKDRKMDKQQQIRLEKMNQERAHGKNLRFTFFGKIVDLDGNPVQNAKVIMGLTSVPVSVFMNDQKLVESFTDTDGQFVITEEGFQLYLVSLEREGYEYRFQYNPERGFNFRKGEKKAELGQISNQPVVFKMRKKGTPALVLNGSARFGLQPGGVAFFDLLWQKWGYPDDLFGLRGGHKGWHSDLKITLEGGRKNPRVVLEAMDSDTGILLDEKELFEAPQQGYRPKIVLPFTEFETGKGFHTYAYVKGRGGEFYTRIFIQAGVGNENNPEKRFADMDVLYTTNPNGVGNFESDAGLMQQYMEDVSSGKRRPFGYDPTAKPYTIEDVRKLLGK